MKVKQIEFKHSELGVITVHTKIPENTINKVGTIDLKGFNSKLKLYNAEIYKEENGNFSVYDLFVVKSDIINVGWMPSKSQSYINLIRNVLVSRDKIEVYPSAIVSVTYYDEEI